MSGALTPPGAGWPLVGEDIRLGALETGPFGPLHRGLLLDMISFMCLSSLKCDEAEIFDCNIPHLVFFRQVV